MYDPPLNLSCCTSWKFLTIGSFFFYALILNLLHIDFNAWSILLLNLLWELLHQHYYIIKWYLYNLCVVPVQQSCSRVSANEYSCAHRAQINFGFNSGYGKQRPSNQWQKEQKKTGIVSIMTSFFLFSKPDIFLFFDRARICKPFKEPRKFIPSLAELISRNRFMGSLNVYKYGLRFKQAFSPRLIPMITLSSIHWRVSWSDCLRGGWQILAKCRFAGFPSWLAKGSIDRYFDTGSIIRLYGPMLSVSLKFRFLYRPMYHPFSVPIL